MEGSTVTVPTQPQKYRSKVVEVEAIQWNGKNFADVNRFAEEGFNSGSDEDGLWAEVYNHLTQAFIPVHLQEFVVKGTHGEFYPCNPQVFKDKYDPVETPVGEQDLGLYEGDLKK